MTRRVVITGLGTVNSLSSDIPTFWDYLCAGRSGVSLIEQFDTSAFKVHFGGEVKNFVPENHLEGKVAKRLDRFSQFALVAAISAVKDSGIDFSQGGIDIVDLLGDVAGFPVDRVQQRRLY